MWRLYFHVWIWGISLNFKSQSSNFIFPKYLELEWKFCSLKKFIPFIDASICDSVSKKIIWKGGRGELEGGSGSSPT